MGTFVPSQVLGFSFPLELVVALRQMSTLKVTQKGHFSSHLLKDPQENLLISKKCVGSFSELQPVGFLETHHLARVPNEMLPRCARTASSSWLPSSALLWPFLQDKASPLSSPSPNPLPCAQASRRHSRPWGRHNPRPRIADVQRAVSPSHNTEI